MRAKYQCKSCVKKSLKSLISKLTNSFNIDDKSNLNILLDTILKPNKNCTVEIGNQSFLPF